MAAAYAYLQYGKKQLKKKKMKMVRKEKMEADGERHADFDCIRWWRVPLRSPQSDKVQVK